METAVMAAPQYVGSRTGQSEERAGSMESFVTSRRTLPTVSHVSFERPVSPGQVAEPPGKSMWEQICEGRQSRRPSACTRRAPHCTHGETEAPRGLREVPQRGLQP